MMIITYDGPLGHSVTQELHIPGDKPTMKAFQVAEVLADGTELEEVLLKIEGIPKCLKRVQTWYGDDARYIVANLF